MRILFLVNCLILTVGAFTTSYAQAILLHKKNATVWLPRQTVAGEVQGFDASAITLHHNGNLFKLKANDGKFKLDVKLTPSANKIWVTASDNGKMVSSDTLNLTLGYLPVAVAKPYALIDGSKVILKYKLLNNINGERVTYQWSASTHNPAMSVVNYKKHQARVVIPKIDGIYYYKLKAITKKGAAVYTTYIKRTGNKLHAFNMDTDNVTWLDKAVIYEITPNNFVKKGSYDDITKKLPELKLLGINTIWLQPVYKTKRGGQGYDVIDYFSLRNDIGTEEQLAALIKKAKELDLKVLFDFVPNHTSIEHPYAIDCAKYGRDSHYYKYYQHVNDGVAYSSNYHINNQGFVYYFWDSLVNLDYNNTEVQQWITEACKYWLNKYDIDGYRFDAVWGLNARTPAFSKRLRTELKAIKPDFLLLAEDKASDPNVYKQGFDAAYDWTPDTAWVSQWSWQTDHSLKKSLTIFNHADSLKRVEKLKNQLYAANSNSKNILRFIENNDIPRFIAAHNIEQTKTAAALMFALPGIPMLYNGQEIGSLAHPYSAKAIFSADQSIASGDENGLFQYYQKLIKLRDQYPALRSASIKDVKVTNSSTVVAFHKWEGDEHFIIMANLTGDRVDASLNLEGLTASIPMQKSSLKELINKNAFDCKNLNNINNLVIPISGYEVRWLLVSRQ